MRKRLILLICLIFLGKADINEKLPPVQPIPRRIWAYWDSTESTPMFIRSCIENWKALNPEYNVTMVTRSTIPQYISRHLPSSFERLSSQGVADWVRLCLLLEHGGFWIDASSILTRSLDWVRQQQMRDHSQGLMYYLSGWTHIKNYPMLENWYISSVPHSEFILRWLVEFEIVLNEFGNVGWLYANYLIDKYGYAQFKNIIQGIPESWGVAYLTQHMAHQKVMQIDSAVHNFTLLPAEHGPYRLQNEKAHWCNILFASVLLRDSADFVPGKSSLPALIKLNGQNRWVLLKILAGDVPVHSNSIVRQFVFTEGYRPPRKYYKREQ